MGCSASMNDTSNVQPNVEKLNSLQNSNEELNSSSTINFIENTILVWLIDQPLSSVICYTPQFRRIISAIKVFDDPSMCYAFLASIQDEIIFLVISTKNVEFIEQCHEISQIYNIYLFDFTNQPNTMDMYDRNSDINIFHNMNALCNQLAEDRELVELDSLVVVTINPSASHGASIQRIAAFLISQYMKDLVRSYKFEPNAKTLFADFCRTRYSDDAERLNDIDDYDRNYRPEEALKWLHKSCFVSRILNRMQHIPDIDMMYKLGFMMKHMIMLLVDVHNNMNSLLGDIPLTLYRGKTMSKDEFNIFNQDIRGSFLSTAAFLIANTNKNLTIDLLRRIITHRPEQIALLFEIHIDLTKGTSAPIALLESTEDDIQLQSDEFCFSIGTIFRIESIEKSDNDSIDIWEVKLIVADDADTHLSHILKQIRNDEALENPSLAIAKLCMDAGYLDHAAKYFFQLVEDKSILRQPSRFVRVSCAVADVLMKKNKAEKAVDYYEKALSSGLNILKPDHLDLIPIYNSLGQCYSKINKYELALENYEKAAQLMRDNNIESIDQETMNYLNIHITELKKLIDENH